MSVNATNRSILANYILGQQSSSVQGRNYVKNSFARDGVQNVTVSGTATVAQNTTTPLTAISDFLVTLPNNATDYVEWTLDTLDNSLTNQNCQLTLDYKVGSIGSVVQAQVLINGVLSVSQTIAASPTQGTISLNSPCGTLANPTTVRISNATGNSGTSSINVANVNYGKATNIGTTNAATVFAFANSTAGSAYTGGATFPFSNVTIDTVGGFSGGAYTVKIAGVYELSTSIYNNVSGTVSILQNATTISTNWTSGIVSGVLPTVMVNAVVGDVLKVTHSSSMTPDASTVEYWFSVKGTPSSSQQVMNAQTSASSWSGISTLSGTTTSASYADLGSVSGSITTQATSGMTCTAAASLVGITCTLPRTGIYQVCYSGTMSGNLTNRTQIRLVDGSGAVVVGEQIAWNVNEPPFGGCSNYRATSTSVTFKVQGNATSGITMTGTPTSFSVTGIDQNLPTPILVGSVTSNSAGALRTEYATMTCSSSAAITSTSTSGWLSITNISSSRCALTFAAGTFSAIPTCIFNVQDTATNRVFAPSPSVTSTTAASIGGNFVNTGSSTVNNSSNDTYSVICQGPR